MRILPKLALYTLGLALATGCGPGGWRLGAVGAAQADQPLAVASSAGTLELRRLSGPLDRPWSLAFLPDGRMLVSERSGRLRLIEADGTLAAEPLAGVPAVRATGQGGLFDVVLHPDFATNGLVYLAYAAETAGSLTTHLARARLDGMALVDVELLFVATTGGRTGRHFGGRLAFDRDGFLYLAIGDRGEMERAQDLADYAGTVVRLHDDGRIPADNPFIGRDDALPAVFAYGTRNAQGLRRNPATGEIWAHEHGPRGGDEVNIIRAGANYGWPVVTHGIDYSGLPISDRRSAPGMVDPLWVWTPSIAPSGMAFYDHDAIPGWQGDLLVGALAGQMLVRLEVEGDTITGEERLLERAIGRIRDVRVGPDGAIYLLTDESDGGLYRLAPAAG
jgi:glucose/arabinose dehydrogenase